MLARVGGGLDFLMRLAFFATAPFALVGVASVFPVTGALVQIGVGLLAFFAGEALRRVASRSRLLGFALSSQLAFEAHYRAHRPRPFLYYVFYPRLFPYWLTVASARREFLLFKGYTLLSFALLLVSLGAQYLQSFPPDLRGRGVLAHRGRDAAGRGGRGADVSHADRHEHGALSLAARAAAARRADAGGAGVGLGGGAPSTPCGG